ncbi:MAG: glycoside hydrolase family 88 protein [Anaerocolumna sp.]
MDRKKIENFIENYYTDMGKVRMDKWNYEDGCILIAATQLYKATGKELFRSFVLDYIDQYIIGDGTIRCYLKEEYNLDNIAPGRILIFAYEQTGDMKYYKAAKLLKGQLEGQPRTESGSFWHKKIYPGQIWLDGLFMAQPFYMAFETKFGKKEGYKDIITQFKNVCKFMYHDKKELYYHGYDESRKIVWANKDTGCSKNFWLRSIGWYQLSIIDTMEEMCKAIYEDYTDLEDIFKEALRGILKYQDPESKLFYQVVDHPEIEGNYLETSGSALLSAAILKACHMRVLLYEKYWERGEEILHNLIEQKLVMVDGRLTLKDNCQVAGLGPDENRRDGTIAYYLSEPITDNDQKGIAALFMAYAQYLMKPGGVNQ